jgi:hypothetical protein
MSLIIKGLGTNVLTKGFGTSLAAAVLREVLRLKSRIATIMNVSSKWRKIYSD